MGCSYYEFRNNDYYCHKKNNYVNSDVYNKYCRNYEYSYCPIYKNQSNDEAGGCYITSACVFARGLPDDCYALRILRRYRDSWLMGQNEGIDLINEYYRIAPIIVSSINNRPDKKEIYNNIYEQMVMPCVRLIEQKKFKDSLILYKTMTMKLKEYLFYGSE